MFICIPAVYKHHGNVTYVYINVYICYNIYKEKRQTLVESEKRPLLCKKQIKRHLINYCDKIKEK